MIRYIIIGLIVLGVILGLVDACWSGVQNLYSSAFSTHERVLDAIDEGNLSKAKKLLPDAKESELYRCAQLLIEEYIAIDDVKNAIYVFERITPNHCSTYEMQWGHYATADYTKAVTTMLYNALIKQGEYEQAWKYHKLEYEDVDYPGNASCYYSYITDVLETLCKNKQIREAQGFLDDHISWFRRNVDNAKFGESYQEYNYKRMKEKLQLFIDEYTKGGE